MDALSLHLSFQVDGNPFQDKDIWEKIQTIPCLACDTQPPPAHVNLSNGNKILIASNSNSHIVMHVYSHGLVTLDIQYDVTSEAAKQFLSTEQGYSRIKRIETRIQTILGKKCKYTRSIPAAITRGHVCPYFVLGDDRLYESKPLSLIAEVNSPWQNVKIYKTLEYGNMLCLNDDIMICEADDMYASMLLGVERNEFKDRTVLILGGGDGNLLHELLKRSPKHVLMVEIDIEVINLCRKHLRKVCGQSLDSLSGTNYTIRIDNCLDVLKELMDSNQKFDYVINALSEYLLGSEIDHIMDFKSEARMLECSEKILAVGGRYLSRGGPQCHSVSLEAYIKDVLANGLQYEMFIINVPSFPEPYCLFEVWRPEQDRTC